MVEHFNCGGEAFRFYHYPEAKHLPTSRIILEYSVLYAVVIQFEMFEDTYAINDLYQNSRKLSQKKIISKLLHFNAHHACRIECRDVS